MQNVWSGSLLPATGLARIIPGVSLHRAGRPPPIHWTGGPGPAAPLQPPPGGPPPKGHAGAAPTPPAGRSTRRAAHAQWSRAIPSAASRPAGPQGDPPGYTDSVVTAEGTVSSGRGEGGWGWGGG